MCLAIPGKIKSIRRLADKNRRATVDFNGIEKEVNCELVKVKKGDYVVVHAGFAIQKLEKEEADEILSLFKKGIKPKK